MSEIVDRRMESMVLEFEEMERTKLFNFEETRTIKKKRKEFEQKINCGTKFLKDYKEYIAYELCLYRLMKARRNKMQMGEKKKNLEIKVLQRIKTMYEVAINRFPTDIELYFSFFKFCKETHFTHAATSMCTMMIKHHKDNEEIWRVAARWYLHDRKEINHAMTFLHEGLKIHPSSKILYSECIQFEVRSVLCKIKSENPTPIYTMFNKKLQTYIDEMKKVIDDVKHYIEIATWLEAYDFTLPIQSHLIEYLLKAFRNSSITWDFLAQRERRGIHYGEHTAKGKSNTNTKILFCIEKYEEGLKCTVAEERETLWDLYLNSLVDIKTEELAAPSLDKGILNLAFERASTARTLPEKCYIAWLDVVDDANALIILENCTAKLSQSVDLWKLRLRYDILSDNREAIMHTFQLGNKALENEANPLWILMHRYHILSSSNDEIEEFYKAAIAQHPNISDIFKPKYIQWISLTKGINMCRETYRVLAKERPYCKAMYEVMNQIESAQLEPALVIWEELHMQACDQFGMEDVEVWLNYILFHCDYNQVENYKQTIWQIYETARKILPHYLFLDLSEKFKALQENLR